MISSARAEQNQEVRSQEDENQMTFQLSRKLTEGPDLSGLVYLKELISTLFLYIHSSAPSSFKI